jgi:hypothetical protein
MKNDHQGEDQSIQALDVSQVVEDFESLAKIVVLHVQA